MFDPKIHRTSTPAWPPAGVGSVAGDAAPAPPANPPEEGDLNDFSYQKSANAMVKYENTG